MHSKGCIGNTAWSLELHCCMDLVSSWARRKVSTPSPRLRALPSPNSHLPLQGRRKGGDVSTFNLPSKPFLLRLFCPSLCVSLFVFPHHFLARHLFFPIIFSLAICRTHAHETELHNDCQSALREPLQCSHNFLLFKQNKTGLFCLVVEKILRQKEMVHITKYCTKYIVSVP